MLLLGKMLTRFITITQESPYQRLTLLFYGYYGSRVWIGWLSGPDSACEPPVDNHFITITKFYSTMCNSSRQYINTIKQKKRSDLQSAS